MTWVLHAGSCLGRNAMTCMADRSVDVVIMDPPFEAEAHTRRRRVTTGKGRARAVRHQPHDFPPITPELRRRAALQVARLARRWIVVKCQPEAAHLWRADLELGGAEYHGPGAWVKADAKPNYGGDGPSASGYEALVICHAPRAKGVRKRWNGGGKAAIYTYPKGVYQEGVNGQVKKLHSAQTPLAFARELVRDFSDPGEIVLDPFAGVGTLGVAARAEGRLFIGWEVRKKWAVIGQRRIDGDEAIPDREQPSLFDSTLWAAPAPPLGAHLLGFGEDDIP